MPIETEGEKELREKLASIEHERWADWHVWAFQNWTPENIARWNTQAKTPYSDLTDYEKEKDRNQVDRYWPLILSEFKALEARKEGEIVKEKNKLFYEYTKKVHDFITKWKEDEQDELTTFKEKVREMIESKKGHFYPYGRDAALQDLLDDPLLN